MKAVRRALPVLIVCTLLLALLFTASAVSAAPPGHWSTRQTEESGTNSTANVTADEDNRTNEGDYTGLDDSEKGSDPAPSDDSTGYDDDMDDGSSDLTGDDDDDEVPASDENEVPDDDGGKDDPHNAWTDMFKQPSFLILGGMLLGLFILLMAVFLIYTKIKHDQLLDHQMRMEIYNHIQKHPGQHFRSILKDMGLKSGVLTHHINMLEREEYIKSVQDGIYRRFYVYEAKADGRQLLNEHQEDILKVVKARPGVSQTEIADQLGITRMLVNYHLKVLTSKNLVKLKKSGRTSACYPVEENT